MSEILNKMQTRINSTTDHIAKVFNKFYIHQEGKSFDILSR